MRAVVGPTLGVPLQEQDAVVEAVCGTSFEWREKDEAETVHKEMSVWCAPIRELDAAIRHTQLARGPSLHPPLEIRRTHRQVQETYLADSAGLATGFFLSASAAPPFGQVAPPSDAAGG